jgi:phage shock protein PspC (stress-responsive transcriptional regulator)
MNPDYADTIADWVRRLHRDRDNALFMGVCAGIADVFRWPVWGVRLGAVLLLLTFFVPTALVYLIAGVLLPGKRLEFRGRGEANFWRKRPRSRHDRYWA